MEARKRCSKRSRSSSSSSDASRSDASRKKGHFKEPKMSSKVEHYRAKKCSDVEADRNHKISCDQLASKVERKRKGRKVKKRRSKSEESSSFSSSESDNTCTKKRKRKEKKRKEKKKKKKHKREKERRINDLNSENQDNLGEGTSKEVQEETNVEPGPSVTPANSTEEPKQRAMAPMTKEEYDRQQSKVRRVFDHDTGRERLIKGEGEIIEDIVSYERHQAINKLATAGDGAVFQKSLGLNRYDHDSKIYRS